MKNSPQDFLVTALECRGGPFHGQLLGIADGLATIDVRVGSLRIRYRRIRETLTWEPYLQFEGAEVVKLAGLTVLERPATLDEAMWAGVPRV